MPMYYRGANICIIVYDVTCMVNFIQQLFPVSLVEW